uniref:Selenide, water dikinase SelD n=1 Tax=candidate division WOR-3 bacterium TaxID=2052148 RepID=A0A7C3Z0Q3_UNCW3
MAQALKFLPRVKDKRVLVGFNTADDAGVYQLDAKRALVQTVDVFTPVIDDPYIFGQIAACNSLSDIYAMGGKPLVAMNIIGFNTTLPIEDLGMLLKGGQKKAEEANCPIIGGHTIRNDQIFYGLAVTGLVNPKRIITNANAQPGDLIFLTKPLGTGTVAQALILREEVPEETKRLAIESMTRLNRETSLVMQKVGVNAATDVTGFGLLGHLFEMAVASKVGIKVFASEIPLIEGVKELVEKGIIDSGVMMNKNSFGAEITFAENIPPFYQTILFGSESSGGFLISCPKRKRERLFEGLKRKRIEAKIIGEVTKENPGKILVL